MHGPANTRPLQLQFVLKTIPIDPHWLEQLCHMLGSKYKLHTGWSLEWFTMPMMMWLVLVKNVFAKVHIVGHILHTPLNRFLPAHAG